MYLKIFQLQNLVTLGLIVFLFPVRCTPQKGFSRNLWAGIQIWVKQGGRSNVSLLPYYMTVVRANRRNRYLLKKGDHKAAALISIIKNQVFKWASVNNIFFLQAMARYNQIDYIQQNSFIQKCHFLKKSLVTLFLRSRKTNQKTEFIKFQTSFLTFQKEQ